MTQLSVADPRERLGCTTSPSPTGSYFLRFHAVCSSFEPNYSLTRFLGGYIFQAIVIYDFDLMVARSEIVLILINR